MRLDSWTGLGLQLGEVNKQASGTSVPKEHAFQRSIVHFRWDMNGHDSAQKS